MSYYISHITGGDRRRLPKGRYKRGIVKAKKSHQELSDTLEESTIRQILIGVSSWNQPTEGITMRLGCEASSVSAYRETPQAKWIGIPPTEKDVAWWGNIEAARDTLKKHFNSSYNRPYAYSYCLLTWSANYKIPLTFENMVSAYRDIFGSDLNRAYPRMVSNQESLKFSHAPYKETVKKTVEATDNVVALLETIQKMNNRKKTPSVEVTSVNGQVFEKFLVEGKEVTKEEWEVYLKNLEERESFQKLNEDNIGKLMLDSCTEVSASEKEDPVSVINESEEKVEGENLISQQLPLFELDEADLPEKVMGFLFDHDLYSRFVVEKTALGSKDFREDLNLAYGILRECSLLYAFTNYCVEHGIKPF